MHRIQDTFPLSHFRRHTREHLERLRRGQIETITRNGQAVMVMMSPERYDFLIRLAEESRLMRDAIRAQAAPQARPAPQPHAAPQPHPSPPGAVADRERIASRSGERPGSGG